jgi:hypothetical protein
VLAENEKNRADSEIATIRSGLKNLRHAVFPFTSPGCGSRSRAFHALRAIRTSMYIRGRAMRG